MDFDKAYDDAAKRMFDLAYYPQDDDDKLKRLLPRLNDEKEPDDGE